MIVNSLATLREAHQLLDEQFDAHHYVDIEIKRVAGQRSSQQNRALHKFCALLADQLNAAGFDMRRVLKQDVDIPWNTLAVKDFLWRPIQTAMTGKESTTEMTTVEPTVIHEVLARHLGQKLGIVCPPWPKKEAE